MPETRAFQVALEAEPDSPRSRRELSVQVVLRLGAAAAGIFLFVFALQVVKAGSGSLLPILDGLSIQGPVNSVGFGWLLAYVAMSGSPVAAIGVTLLSSGVLTEAEAFGVIGGSRLGASFIVLAVGFVLFLRRRRNADGLSIGVIALVTTFTTQGPAIALGLISLHYGWLDALQFSPPPTMLDWVDRVYGRPVEWIDARLAGGVVFAIGVGVLLASFAVFDRALPRLEAGSSRVETTLHRLNTRPLMFAMGCVVTAMTLSVSISLTLLVPLSLKGYLKREHIIPYVMGANITTFIDTLAGALILGGDTAFTVVLTEMLAVAAVSSVLLTVAYGPYSRLILGTTHQATRSKRNMGIFLGAIVAVPAVLMLV